MLISKVYYHSKKKFLISQVVLLISPGGPGGPGGPSAPSCPLRDCPSVPLSPVWPISPGSPGGPGGPSIYLPAASHECGTNRR